MFSRLFLLRKQEKVLKTFAQIFKEPNDDVTERQRAAAFKAWETRRRAAEKLKQGEGALGPDMARLDAEVARIAKEVIPNMHLSALGGYDADSGINTTGIIKTPDGRQMFLKVGNHGGRGQESQQGYGAQREVAAWEVAKAVGWGDVVLPMHFTKIEGKAAIVRDLMPEGKVWARTDPANQEKALADGDRMRKVAMYEYLIWAGDRHEGNYWVDKNNKLWPIDLGISFREDTRVHHSYIYKPQDFLRDVPKKYVKDILDHKDEIIKAAGAVNARLAGVSNGDDAKRGVERRLSVIEKAYNQAQGDTVNIVESTPFAP